MTITTTNIVLGVGTFLAVLMVIILPWLIRRAWRDGPECAVGWRAVKLTSTFVGLIGLGLAFISFEKVVREHNGNTARYLNEEFLDLKFHTNHLMSVACAKDLTNNDALNECRDFRQLDSSVSFIDIRDGRKLTPPKIWYENPNLEHHLKELAWRFKNINSAIDNAREPQLMSYETSVKVTLFALILIALAMAGSIGEAAYQLKQELLRAKR